MKTQGNIWIELQHGVKVGKGRADLLEKIRETGSIAEAARVLGLSYRKAWAMVKEMNAGGSLKIIEKSAGGKHGGGARLTAEGEKILAAYRKLTLDFEKFRLKYSEQ
jgi:molybdate transport system regulatory protein